jgi:hypothetical protein
MTITLTDSNRPTDDGSLNAALARVASTRRASGTTAAYGPVTVRMTVRNGRVTEVVAI